MEIRTLVPETFSSNTYLLISGRHALIVDPGVEYPSIRKALAESGAVCEGILLTHGHFDHMLSLEPLLTDHPDAPVMLHEADRDFPGDSDKNAYSRFFGKKHTWRQPDRLLHDGDRIPLGEEAVSVLHTPGHTPGSVCFQTPAGLLSGDTLFASGFGRYDLYGGDPVALLTSLRSLSHLPATLPLYPGHGQSSSLARALAASGMTPADDR